MMGWPKDNSTLIKKLAASDLAGKVSGVKMLGNDKLSFTQTAEGLKIQLPEQTTGKNAFVLKIEGAIV
jgi:alpha-L-fucosidase